MTTGWRRHGITATLLLAALSVYVDVPRLHLAASLGDTLNAARVLDPIQHMLMQLRLDALTDSAQIDALSEKLHDGRESLELLSHVAPVQGVLPGRLVFEAAGQPPTCEALAIPTLVALPGRLLTLDLPPPALEALWRPPTFQAPGLSPAPLRARAPPVMR